MVNPESLTLPPTMYYNLHFKSNRSQNRHIWQTSRVWQVHWYSKCLERHFWGDLAISLRLTVKTRIVFRLLFVGYHGHHWETLAWPLCQTAYIDYYTIGKQEAPLTLRGQRGRCRNIKGEPQIFGSFPSQKPRPLFLWVWFYGGPWQTEVVYRIWNR